MYGIQSIASERFLKFNDNIHSATLDEEEFNRRYYPYIQGDRKYEWSKSPHHAFKTYEIAENAIRVLKLKNVKIVVLYDNIEIDKGKRRDLNRKFLTEINEKARKFKMSSVGIKSIDKIINKDVCNIDQVIIKPKIKSHICLIYDKVYEIFYEHTKLGHIYIHGYQRSNIILNTYDKVIFLRMNNEEGVYKFIVGYYEAQKKEIIPTVKINQSNRLFNEEEIEEEEEKYQEYIIDNPHNFYQGIDSMRKIPTQTPKISTSNTRRVFTSTRKHLCYIKDSWYYVTYIIDSPGRVNIINYEKTKEVPLHKENIAVAVKHYRFGINTLIFKSWGSDFEENVFVINNPHSLIGGKI